MNRIQSALWAMGVSSVSSRSLSISIRRRNYPGLGGCGPRHPRTQAPYTKRGMLLHCARRRSNMARFRWHIDANTLVPARTCMLSRGDDRP